MIIHESSFSEWIISRIYAQPYNNFPIASACMCTLYIVRELLLNIGISLKGAIMDFISVYLQTDMHGIDFFYSTLTLSIYYISCKQTHLNQVYCFNFSRWIQFSEASLLCCLTGLVDPRIEGYLSVSCEPNK